MLLVCYQFCVCLPNLPGSFQRLVRVNGGGGGGVGVGDCSGTIAEDAECLLSGFRLKMSQSHGKTDRKLTSSGACGMISVGCQFHLSLILVLCLPLPANQLSWDEFLCLKNSPPPPPPQEARKTTKQMNLRVDAGKIKKQT